MKKRKYIKHVINKGWFKKGNKPHNTGKPLTEKEKNRLSKVVKKSMAKLPDYVKKRIRKTQFKKGHIYSHWTGKYGHEHPNYKGVAYRNQAFASKKKKCEKCGKTKFKSLSQLHIHHKDKNRLNQKLNNLQVLCSKCHLKIHKNWKYRWDTSKEK